MKAQRLDQQREGRRLLPPARVMEVIAREGRAPVGEHPDQPPRRGVGQPRRFLRDFDRFGLVVLHIVDRLELAGEEFLQRIRMFIHHRIARIDDVGDEIGDFLTSIGEDVHLAFTLELQ